MIKRLILNPWTMLVAVVLGMIVVVRVLLLGPTAGYDQTSLLYLGVPLILTLLLGLIARPKSCFARSMIGVTVFLILALLALKEGFICVLLSAPIFYGIAALVGGSMDLDAHYQSKKCTKTLVPALALLSLEGTFPQVTHDRMEEVTVVRDIALSDAEVRQALQVGFPLKQDYHWFFRLGFPRATEWHWQEDGRVVVDFPIWDLENPTTLELWRQDVDAHTVRYIFGENTTPTPKWLTWRDAEVSWEALDAETVRLSWTVRYRRDLDPAWYFGPLERYGVTLATEHLVDSLEGATHELR